MAGLAAAAMAVPVLPALATAATAAPDSGITVEVLSTRPDTITGGDALVQVRVPDDAAAKHLRLEAAGTDRSSTLVEVAPRTFQALLTDLPEGESTLVARANGKGKGTPAGRSATLQVENFRTTGPIYSGPQQQPWVCENATAGLAPATDSACSAPVQVQYRYRTTAGTFAPLTDPAKPPADVATIQRDGTAVPYVVRLERGVLNRGLYEIAALYDGQQPSPFRAERGLNGAMAMTFGGGCNVGYHMGPATAGVMDDNFLSRGYVVLSSSLLVNNTNCNPVTASETALMVKERAIETYGVDRHTMGWGGSGGAIMQYTIQHAYPGILDGLLPSVSYADSVSNAGPPDCELLLKQGFAGVPLNAAQQAAIAGAPNPLVCHAWSATFADRIDATRGCDPVVPRPLYHPDTAPDGVRCSLADHLVTQLGKADDGFARPSFSNDGVQYGLTALQNGTITAEQFLRVNEQVGGYDRDGVRQPQRTVGDPVAFRRAFETGLITSGLGGIGQVPTIDLRTYTDNAMDIHNSFWSVAIHERLVRDGVDPRVHARWIFTGSRAGEAIDAMEQWLTAIDADTAAGTAEEKVVRNRPAAASDGCWPTPTGGKVEDLAACYSGAYPYKGDSRTAAGGPITTDVGMCQQKPLDRAAYAQTFTDEQWARMEKLFPNGVCDYSEPGVGQVPLTGTWQTY
ncbi:UNVERIFIED_ORG: hypothetical protein E4P37_06580 [Bacillus sp. AZ43]